jgi:hypothetical protein
VAIDRRVLGLLCVSQSPGDPLDQLSGEVIAGEVARRQVLAEHNLGGDLICGLGRDEHTGHGFLLRLGSLKQFFAASRRVSLDAGPESGPHRFDSRRGATDPIGGKASATPLLLC